MQNTTEIRAQQVDTDHSALPHICYGGYHYITVEEDDEERVEVIRCRRCAAGDPFIAAGADGSTYRG